MRDVVSLGGDVTAGVPPYLVCFTALVFDVVTLSDYGLTHSFFKRAARDSVRPYEYDESSIAASFVSGRTSPAETPNLKRTSIYTALPSA
jgi:hypothetical protein